MLIENYLGYNLNHFMGMTYHAGVEREERIRNILKAVGQFGTVVATIHQPDLHACRHITDMGIVVVTDEWCEVLITAWIPDNVKSACRFFLDEDGNMVERVPTWMAHRILYAQKKQKQILQKRVKVYRNYDEWAEEN